MKGVVVLLLFVTFCVVVPLALSSRRLTASSDVVVDVEGKELKIGEPYYALFKGTLILEGLCLKDLKNETSCPHDVIQCTLFDQPLVDGLPIVFSNSSSAFVMENTFYTVKFDNSSSSCAGDTTWGMAQGSDTNSQIVTTDPAAKAVQFQLSREEYGYTIYYCITIPLPNVPICYAIGFIKDGFNSRLGVGVGIIQPVQFFFKAKPSGVKKHATS